MAYEEYPDDSTMVVDTAAEVHTDEVVSPLYLAALGRVAAQKAQGFEGNADPNGSLTAFDSSTPLHHAQIVG